MFFETKRLRIKKLIAVDVSDFCEMQSNENVMRYVTGNPKTIEESINELEKILHSYQNMNSDFMIMKIVKKDCNRFIGTCGIIKNNDGEHEIGYRFHETYWGKGYGKEILDGLIDFAFKSLCLAFVVAYVEKDNCASVKMLDHSALEFVKEYKENEEMIRYYKLYNHSGYNDGNG